jgi:tyrosinase
MTLPKEAELLGANSGELEIKGAGASTVVRLSADGQRRLSALLGGPSTAEWRGGVYLGLENIRGTFDAAVLNTYINLPENARSADHHHLMAESVGLYGLRMASVRQGKSSGQGLTFILEITRILKDLMASKSLNAEQIHVSILPERPLPDSVTIAIGRVSIFTTSPSS